MPTKYQKEPFNIVLGRYGKFKAFAADGVIEPGTKKAARNMYNPAAREAVEVHAKFYLKRPDWEWRVPEKYKELVDEVAEK